MQSLVFVILSHVASSAATEIVSVNGPHCASGLVGTGIVMV
jgi:hypothetical protein